MRRCSAARGMPLSFACANLDGTQFSIPIRRWSSLVILWAIRARVKMMMRLQTLKKPVVFVALVAIYFVLGKVSLKLAFVHPSATLVWLPSGLALAAFVLLGYWVWPAILLGAFLVNVTTAGSIGTSVF